MDKTSLLSIGSHKQILWRRSLRAGVGVVTPKCLSWPYGTISTTLKCKADTCMLRSVSTDTPKCFRPRLHSGRSTCISSLVFICEKESLMDPSCLGTANPFPPRANCAKQCLWRKTPTSCLGYLPVENWPDVSVMEEHVKCYPSITRRHLDQHYKGHPSIMLI